ncbi:LLM class flavin-dependent oxidoreductase [Frankia sp. AgB1.9]|uniref:LLM class flavin-dependent oxidoreductase n=1 Tax=unclassified Frankia TaxID=2632575 RepID=UPI0019336BE7|nr:MULTISPECIES: LLM class flavin-dependent oxidoreductase [unclassified Frankia]MBL7489645.1 LLM class flavin-dependent oxidoreductase [Frankia sp. AgW1.1]MBL7548611.1 LLM class flavin-dependent oxidoreductase [Frankia sp. AgB1.9]MBL7621563.1 LLM class flavin-dependent oxidoreductase [Frankia sp. AgB1.8]
MTELDEATRQARTVLAADRVSLGCVAPRTRAGVAAAEAAGAEALWVGGHVASPNGGPEALAWLARLSAQAERAVVGTAVLLLPLYQPAIVAKQLADLDVATGGRLALGVGVGGEYPAEFDACGVPLAGRGRRTDEAIGLVRELWTGEPVTWDGPLFPMKGVRMAPAPSQPGGPPVLVAGRAPVAMRRAARLGDGWMPYLYSAERYARSVATVRAEAAAVGRDLDGFTWAAYLPFVIDDDGERARRRAAEFLGGTYRQDFAAMIDRVAVAGTPEQVEARLGEYIAAGARHLALLPATRDGGEDMVLQALTDLAPRLRAAGARS